MFRLANQHYLASGVMISLLLIFSLIPAKVNKSPLKSPLLCQHHLDKLVVVDDTVTVLVGLADHFVDLGVGQLFTEVGYNSALYTRRQKEKV